jgi:lactate/malate dehydrogenase, alpha/beta C-terminal domain
MAENRVQRSYSACQQDELYPSDFSDVIAIIPCGGLHSVAQRGAPALNWCIRYSCSYSACRIGHLVPIFHAPVAQATPPLQLSQDQAKALTERIQDAGTEVVKAKVHR